MNPNLDNKANPSNCGGQRMWLPFLKEEILKLKPDIAVVDLFTVPAFIACDELGIQVVVNMPGMLASFPVFGFNLPNKGNTSNCCGLLCVRQTVFIGILSTIVSYDFNANEWLDHWKKIPNRIIMMNSFWGI